MITRTQFERISAKGESAKYSSLTYTDYEDCADALILRDSPGLCLLKAEGDPIVHYAADDFGLIIKELSKMPGRLRLHFVPKEYAGELRAIGFTEWAEYKDYWNNDLTATLAALPCPPDAEYLELRECETVSEISRRCKLQSRGFEGETAEWFAEWLADNKVIIERVDGRIAGFCCVSIYNEGTTLWIREIAVDPDYQSKGYGGKLLRKALRWGLLNKASKSFLHADILNKNAIALYKKHGYAPKDDESELQMVRESFLGIPV